MFYEHTVALLKERGVSIEGIAEISFQLQNKYQENLTMEECVKSVEAVLQKREVQNAVITGVTLDQLAEQNKLPYPFQQMMEIDEPLYGIDEILALSVTNIYGTIGLTSFGYLDKIKIGVLNQLNHHGDQIHVFLDDLIAGIAASASARIAHRHPDFERYRGDRG